MSPTFGLSYLLSVCAVWNLYKKHSWSNWLFASIAVCLSLGLYQANLGCACFLVNVLVMLLCLVEDDNKSILIFIIRTGSSIAVACISYKILWNLVMKFFRVSASSYNGAANVSVSLIIKRLPVQILAAYSKFYTYFFENIYKHSIFQTTYIYKIIFLLLLLVLLWQGYMLLQKKKWLRLIIYLSGIIILPITCNISVLLAPEAGFLIQQTCAMAIFIPVMFCLLDKKFRDVKNYNWLKRVVLGIGFLILYGNIYMTAIDLEAMYEGKNASENVMNHVVQTLINKGLYNGEKQYFFVGRISNNPLFKTTKFWKDANTYARYGEFWLDISCVHMAYDGILHDMGIGMLIGDDNVCRDYISNGIMEDMPVYPESGSIMDMGEYVLVKISNVY